MNSLKSVWARVAALLMLTICIAVLASCSSSNSSSNESLRIYEMVAGKGSFSAVSGDASGTRFQLNLSNVPANLLYFTDRPAQEAGFDTTANVINNVWPRVYGAVAPNALLQATVANQATINLFCILEKPVYNAATGQLSFALTYLNGNQKPISSLNVTDVKMIILNNAVSAQVEEWSQLMEVGAAVFSAPAADGTVSVTLQQPYGTVFSYSNAPGRKSTIMALKDYLQTWQTRFGSVQPNISFAYNLQGGQTAGVQIVTITKPPVYDEAASTITFTVKILYGTTPVGTGGLRVTAPSLFIDGGSPTYSEADLQKLLAQQDCTNCDLNGADLSGKDLSGKMLVNAKLQAANLTGTILKLADLTSADLTGATVTSANMVGATLLNTIGPSGMSGRVVNLVNNCTIDIWAAASGNTYAPRCTTTADCHGGECKDGQCTKFPCGSNADCAETNTYCGGVPSYKDATNCKSSSDCDPYQFCNVTTGQCGWKNCTYVPIPVERKQIVDTPASCTANKDCGTDQFCYTTTSTTGKCAKLPVATEGNSWQLKSAGTTPLFIPTPWAGRFWPRTGCLIGGNICTDLYAGSDQQCAATSVNNDRKLLVPLTSPQAYQPKCATASTANCACRNDSQCGPPANNSSIAGGKCDLVSTPAFDAGQQHTQSECTVGDDATCDAVKGVGSNYVCIPEKISSAGKEVTIGVCGYRKCVAYQCDSLGKTICNPAVFSCQTGTCYDEQTPSNLTMNCRQSGLNSPTLAELNMFMPTKGIDFYDISLVDGANVPVQIAPVVNTYALEGSADAYNTQKACTTTADCWNALDYNWVCDTTKGSCVNKFYCGSPGCVSDCASYGTKLTDPSTWGGRNLAVLKADCPEELQLRANNKVDGDYVGCLSPTDACSPAHKGDSWRTNLNCDTTHTDLFQCIGANATSCYSAGAGTNCCGYPDWMNDFGTLKKLPSNPDWVSKALPYYQKFHAASPTSYTFPYDDKSATFTCKGKSNAVNVNYNVIFCPK